MPTASEKARAEARTWARIAGHWPEVEAPDLWADRRPTEHAVIVFFDPTEDIRRRGRDWNHDISGTDLSALARFAAGLAESEADAWDRELANVATRAYETRRFLLGDRILHWAVPWLDEAGRSYPDHRESAHSDRDLLLDLGEETRVAPQLPGREGLQVGGEDSYGPMEPGPDLDGWLESLWSGIVPLGGADTGDLVSRYDEALRRWLDLAETRPGSAQLWRDLAARAERTSDLLA
jgi:hypothetical protein